MNANANAHERGSTGQRQPAPSTVSLSSVARGHVAPRPRCRDLATPSASAASRQPLSPASAASQSAVEPRQRCQPSAVEPRQRCQPVSVRKPVEPQDVEPSPSAQGRPARPSASSPEPVSVSVEPLSVGQRSQYARQCPQQ